MLSIQRPPLNRERNSSNRIINQRPPTVKRYGIVPIRKIQTNRSSSTLSTRSTSTNNSKDMIPKIQQRSYSNLRAPYVSAKSYAIFSKGSLLHGKHASEVREIASLTKIMTCYVSLITIKKFKIDLDTLIPITYKASSITGTSAKLQSGDRVILWDLLHGLMLPSGNDAAIALAEYMGKYYTSSESSYNEFLNQMNDHACLLGMTNTHYKNPHGLSYTRNLSTAFDVCKVAWAALKLEQFRQIVNTQVYSATIWRSDGSTRLQQWENTNKMLEQGYNGVKTGVTNNAGPCLCTYYNHNGTEIVIAILRSRSMNHRWVEIPKLNSWAIQHLDNFN